MTLPPERINISNTAELIGKIKTNTLADIPAYGPLSKDEVVDCIPFFDSLHDFAEKRGKELAVDKSKETKRGSGVFTFSSMMLYFIHKYTHPYNAFNIKKFPIYTVSQLKRPVCQKTSFITGIENYCIDLALQTQKPTILYIPLKEAIPDSLVQAKKLISDFFIDEYTDPGTGKINLLVDTAGDVTKVLGSTKQFNNFAYLITQESVHDCCPSKSTTLSPDGLTSAYQTNIYVECGGQTRKYTSNYYGTIGTFESNYDIEFTGMKLAANFSCDVKYHYAAMAYVIRKKKALESDIALINAKILDATALSDTYTKSDAIAAATALSDTYGKVDALAEANADPSKGYKLTIANALPNGYNKMMALNDANALPDGAYKSVLLGQLNSKLADVTQKNLENDTVIQGILASAKKEDVTYNTATDATIDDLFETDITVSCVINSKQHPTSVPFINSALSKIIAKSDVYKITTPEVTTAFKKAVSDNEVKDLYEKVKKDETIKYSKPDRSLVDLSFSKKRGADGLQARVCQLLNRGYAPNNHIYCFKYNKDDAIPIASVAPTGPLISAKIIDFNSSSPPQDPLTAVKPEISVVVETVANITPAHALNAKCNLDQTKIFIIQKGVVVTIDRPLFAYCIKHGIPVIYSGDNCLLLFKPSTSITRTDAEIKEMYDNLKAWVKANTFFVGGNRTMKGGENEKEVTEYAITSPLNFKDLIAKVLLEKSAGFKKTNRHLRNATIIDNISEQDLHIETDARGINYLHNLTIPNNMLLYITEGEPNVAYFNTSPVTPEQHKYDKEVEMAEAEESKVAESEEAQIDKSEGASIRTDSITVTGLGKMDPDSFCYKKYAIVDKHKGRVKSDLIQVTFDDLTSLLRDGTNLPEIVQMATRSETRRLAQKQNFDKDDTVTLIEDESSSGVENIQSEIDEITKTGITETNALRLEYCRLFMNGMDMWRNNIEGGFVSMANVEHETRVEEFNAEPISGGGLIGGTKTMPYIEMITQDITGIECLCSYMNLIDIYESQLCWNDELYKQDVRRLRHMRITTKVDLYVFMKILFEDITKASLIHSPIMYNAIEYFLRGGNANGMYDEDLRKKYMSIFIDFQCILDYMFPNGEITKSASDLFKDKIVINSAELIKTLDYLKSVYDRTQIKVGELSPTLFHNNVNVEHDEYIRKYLGINAITFMMLELIESLNQEHTEPPNPSQLVQSASNFGRTLFKPISRPINRPTRAMGGKGTKRHRVKKTHKKIKNSKRRKTKKNVKIYR